MNSGDCYEIGWYTPDQIIQLRAWGGFDEPLLTRVSVAVLALLNCAATGHRHMLIDVGGITHVALPLASLSTIPSHNAVGSHPRLGWVAIYGSSNPFLNMILEYSSQIQSGRTRIFGDQEQALAFLNSKHSS